MQPWRLGAGALEGLQQVPEVVVPIRGGRTIAGRADAIKAPRPDVKVFATEPRNAGDCHQPKVRAELTPNLHAPATIADAVISTTGKNTRPIIRGLVDDVLTVLEEEIKFQAVPRDRENVCIVLCGGNVDLSSLGWLTHLPREVK